MAKSGNIVLLFRRQQDAAQQDSEKEKLERASSVCRHAGEAKAAPQTLLAKARSAGHEETLTTPVAKLPTEDHSVTSATATNAILASTTEVEDRYSPSWCPDDEYASQLLFDALSPRSTLSGPEGEDQRFVHLQPIIHSDVGR